MIPRNEIVRLVQEARNIVDEAIVSDGAANLPVTAAVFKLLTHMWRPADPRGGA